MSRLVSVAVPVPSVGRLTYRLPDHARAVVGARVVVPIGGRLVTGCVLEVMPPGRAGPADAPQLRDVREVVDDEPFLPPEVQALALWVADYYLATPGEALAAAAPPFAWARGRPHLALTDEGRDRLARGETDATRHALLSALSVSESLDRAAALQRAARSLGLPTARRSPAYTSLLRQLTRLEADGFVKRMPSVAAVGSRFRTVRVALATAAGLDDAIDSRLGPRQREVLTALRAAPEGVDTVEFRRRGLDTAVVTRLETLGLARIVRRRVERDPFVEGGWHGGDVSPDVPQLVLTDEQEQAIGRFEALARQQSFRVALLHGVTGSGKTEVYRRLAERVRALGRSVLILVPEIALTPAVAATFRRTFGDRVAIQHSGLSDGERHDQWHRIRRGDVDVVVGTRSAVFAPLASPGLIIVDEEHDTSYKQEESPRYNGRDVAIVRGRLASAVVVVGSATPSLETFHNALTGRYEHVTLTRRVLERPLADVRVVDMREEFAREGPDVVLSGILHEALAERIADGDQAIVLLNRRGYASAVFCRQCGDTLDCPNCSVSLTVHKAARRARCHYCDHSVRVPETCVSCGAEYLDYVGLGTERVESELHAAFPAARVARVDRDTIRRRGEITAVLRRFAAREIDVLVGTQMIAKGHDFPAVTLVGVISADVGLGLADFRAAERTFQLLTQVAGRAGRGERPGVAIIQTLFPKHYSVVHAATQDYRAFYEQEIAFRRSMQYPPAVALVALVVRAATAVDALADAAVLAREIARARPAFRVLGPAPAPLVRLRGEHRAQLFLKGTSRRAMGEAVARAIAAHPNLQRRVSVDVDPLTVL